MKYTLSGHTVRIISAKTDLTEKAIAKIFGALRVGKKNKEKVEAPPELTEKGEKQTAEDKLGFEIGLRIQHELDFPALPQETVCDIFVKLCSDYKRLCPHIVNWVQWGDFNPSKIPNHISKAHLLHASRTAGRLRSKILRSFSPTPQ